MNLNYCQLKEPCEVEGKRKDNNQYQQELAIADFYNLHK